MFGNKGFFGSSGSVQGALWWTLCRDFLGALRNNHSDLCFSYHRPVGLYRVRCGVLQYPTH